MRGDRASLTLPPGVEFLQFVRGRRLPYSFFKTSVLVLTFLSYMGYHASRKPLSIVKSVLKGDDQYVSVTTASNFSDPTNHRMVLSDAGIVVDVPVGNGWAPFNGPNGQSLLGQVDLAFLGSYAIGMFFSGHLGDRTDLRFFLTVGMVGSGVFGALFGMGQFWDIHSVGFYSLVMIIAGLFQSTGWPSVVSIMANWYGKGKRGLIMGVWNAHTSLGNILGTVMAAAYLSGGWGWSFIMTGCLMVGIALLVHAFLVVQPSDLNGAAERDSVHAEDKELVALLKEEGKADKGEKQAVEESIHFLDACRIPGVMPFALCLFFSKLVAYVFLYWLPYYIKQTPIEDRILNAKEAGDLSVLFDVGGVLGGIMAGHLSDKSGASACVATAFTLTSIPFLYLYRKVGHVSFAINVALMMGSGFFVNGPYALITTAVSADLGTHECLHGNGRALATVTAIIDGMGSIGAAVGPALTGYISDAGGFDAVFMMLYASAALAALLIVRVVQKELQVLREQRARRI